MTGAGRLYLVPAWLSDQCRPEAAIAGPVLERIRSLTLFIVEDAKSARRYLSACGHPGPMRDIAMLELSEHTSERDIPRLLDPVANGADAGLLSEAGLAAVADPGAALVAAAHARGIAVVALPGPSSILLALAASGLEGQRFRFVGYLPAEAAARRTAIGALEKQSARDAETQIFIETPYRNDALLRDLLATCAASTRLAVAAELTSPNEWVRMGRIADWRAHPASIGKRPAIFLLAA